MITLKEFEAYLTVKEFIKKNNFEESDVILWIISFNYVPLIVESSDMEMKKIYLLSAAARGIGVRNKPSTTVTKTEKRE